MDKKSIAVTIAISCAILAIAISIQVRTVKKTNSTVAQIFTENSLRDEVLKWKEKYDNISGQLDASEKKLDKIRGTATKNDSSSVATEQEISANNNLLGTTNLTGQGVEITIADDPSATKDTLGVFEDVSNHIVHDSDLRAVVNALKNAGAEAISINGQRLINTTAITCIGNVIKVNNEKITSPFTIKTIGLQESLSGIDMGGSYIQELKRNGIVVTIKKSDEVEIPKYSGAISAKYMKTVED